MSLRFARVCVVIAAICLLASCGIPTADNPLNFVAAENNNLLINIRPAQIWNSDMMQKLLDEVSDKTIERIYADWDDTFGMKIEETAFLFGAIDLPKSLAGGRVRNAIFIDSWGNPLVYDPDMTVGSRNYKIRSLGSDGQRGPDPEVPGVVEKPEEDFIYSNGNWRQRLEARCKTCIQPRVINSS